MLNIHEILNRIHIRDKYLPLFFLGPAVLYLVAITLYPFIRCVWLSLLSYRLGSQHINFVGLQNYIELFTNLDFFQVLGNTFYLVGAAVFIELVLGLGLALLAMRLLRGETAFRALLLVPMMVMPVVVGFAFRHLFNYNYGLIAYIFDWLAHRITFLSDPTLAIWTIITADIWQWTPFMFVVLLAGLVAIPSHFYEVADISGASKLHTFRYVTLPLLKPVLLVALLIRTMDAFRLFDKVYIITNGGPGISTATLSFWSYKLGFKHFQIGQASSVAVFCLIITVVVSFILNKVLRRRG